MIVPLIPMDSKGSFASDAIWGNSRTRKTTRKNSTTNSVTKDVDRLPRFHFSMKSLSMRISSNESVATSTTIGDEESLSSWESTCSSSRSEKGNLTVRFAHDLVTSIPSDQTRDQVKDTWIAKKEQRLNRKVIQAQQCRLMQVPEYQQAIECVKSRLGHNANVHETMGTMGEEKHQCTPSFHDMEEMEAALVLSRGDWRGLEKAALANRRQMACFVSKVRHAYQNGESEEYIANLCKQRSIGSQAWAQILGKADAMVADCTASIDSTSPERLEL